MDHHLLNHILPRNIGTKPRVHPNGFIQLDISENTKLHVWPDPPLKTVEVMTPHHDHTFNFTSRIIRGALQQTLYKPVENELGEFHLYTVFPLKSLGKETPFVRFDDKRYDMKIVEQFIIRTGQIYAFPAFDFHSSEPIGLTATIITIRPFDKMLQAKVTCRYDQLPRLFKRDSFEEEFLWSIIRQVFTN